MDPMGHLRYMPGDIRLIDQIMLELKSKGIFDTVNINKFYLV